VYTKKLFLIYFYFVGGLFSHFEYGYIIDAGDKPDIKEKDKFLRL
jgi:hypothetical protein